MFGTSESIVCRGMRRSPWVPRTPLSWIAFGMAAVLFALVAYALGTYALSRGLGADVAAYLGAADRLRAGLPLYAGGAANDTELYRYAPWFAYAWVPLSLLPRDAVTAAWVGLMVAAALLSTAPLLRRGPAGWAAFSVFAPLQLQGAVFGNVQPALVLLLMWGVERRSGPIWIAVGASLKAVPLLLALVYAGRGEWLRAGWALLITASLVLPALLFDLSSYSTSPGPGQMSLTSVALPLFLAVAIAFIGLAWVAARGRFAWLAASLAMIAALPRLLSYEIGFLLIGLARRPTRVDPANPSRAQA